MTEPAETLSDEHLAQRAQQGDGAAFEALVRRFEARIYRFARHCCGQEADAREITQDTFVSAYRHLQRFNPSRSFTTWLFTIARRKCIDRSRRTPPVFEEAMPELPDADDPSVRMAQREACHNLWRMARQVLSASQFQALWLHYAEELSVAEVARVMRKTRPHVRVLLFRARSVLGRELRRAGVGGSAPVPVADSSSRAPVAELVNPSVSRCP